MGWGWAWGVFFSWFLVCGVHEGGVLFQLLWFFFLIEDSGFFFQ